MESCQPIKRLKDKKATYNFTACFVRCETVYFYTNRIMQFVGVAEQGAKEKNEKLESTGRSETA
jgi:hypothetical protein